MDTGQNFDIEFVYFDLGNVIVNFDHSRIGENISAITSLSSSDSNRIVFETGLQDRYESGQIATSEFVEEFNDLAETNLGSEDLCLAISDIFWLNRMTLPLITQVIASNIPTGILSNTCPAHWNFVLSKYPIVKEFFGSCRNILSFESVSMKPESKIYQDAIALTGLQPHQVFFMDDRPENVQAATQLGIHSRLFQNANQMTRELHELGLNINL